MNNSKSHKKIFVGLIILFIFTINIQDAEAFFSIESTSKDNQFSTGTLGFSSDKEDISIDISNATTTTSFELSDTGSVLSKYEVKMRKETCDDLFYQNIDLSINKGGVIYNGELSEATATSTSEGEWELEMSLKGSASVSNGQVCEININIEAWQNEFSKLEDGGFSEKKSINLTLTSTVNLGSDVVLNEVLPNPEGSDSQGGLQGEWVELYNRGISSLDISGWYIKDEAGNTITISSTSTHNSRVTIGVPGSGLEWLIVYMPGAVLNNGGDTVYLYDSNDNLIDQYSYGTSVNDVDGDSNNTPGGNNEGPVGDETSGQEGKSDARIPDGANNWVDPIPTPGGPNVLDEGSINLMSSQTQVNDQTENTDPVLEDQQTLDIPEEDKVEEETIVNEAQEETPVEILSDTDTKEETTEVVEEPKKEVPVEEEITETVQEVVEEENVQEEIQEVKEVEEIVHMELIE